MRQREIDRRWEKSKKGRDGGRAKEAERKGEKDIVRERERAREH